MLYTFLIMLFAGNADRRNPLTTIVVNAQLWLVTQCRSLALHIWSSQILGLQYNRFQLQHGEQSSFEGAHYGSSSGLSAWKFSPMSDLISILNILKSKCKIQMFLYEGGRM
jgi:hypothetical protein